VEPTPSEHPADDEAPEALSPAADEQPDATAREALTLRPCPFCGEEIQAAAKKCRFCGEWLDDSVRRRRRRGAVRDPGWALPAAIPVILWVQAAGVGLCGVLVALVNAPPPTFGAGAVLAVTGTIAAVIAVLPDSAGCRRRILLIPAGNAASVVSASAAIILLNISPSRPSFVLASLAGAVALASLALGVFVARTRQVERARR
jgi:hypothetical protein